MSGRGDTTSPLLSFCHIRTTFNGIMILIISAFCLILSKDMW